ncbi:unnamed protein product [Diatraea saccharalis]|uniref:Uncharacterized protein n=1 Tax=Diatraea saccharalis TaxID=40085 RepID=A0A9N9WDF1_9NEOP|nr:unnamed protein product [Diatraea saccharalis]
MTASGAAVGADPSTASPSTPGSRSSSASASHARTRSIDTRRGIHSSCSDLTNYGSALSGSDIETKSTRTVNSAKFTPITNSGPIKFVIVDDNRARDDGGDTSIAKIGSDAPLEKRMTRSQFKEATRVDSTPENRILTQTTPAVPAPEPPVHEIPKPPVIAGKKRQHISPVDSSTNGSDGDSERSETANINISRRKPKARLKDGANKHLAKHKNMLKDPSDIECMSSCGDSVGGISPTRSVSSYRHTREPRTVQPTEEESMEAQTEEQLDTEAKKWLCLLTTTTQKSRNLKGDCRRAMNEATKGLNRVISKLLSRDTPQHIKSLEDRNNQLTSSVNQLKKQVACLSAQVSALSKSSAKTPKSQPVVVDHTEVLQVDGTDFANMFEELKSQLIRTTGDIINARIEGLENRLLPKQNVRPPLASDKKKQQQAPSQSIQQTGTKTYAQVAQTTPTNTKASSCAAPRRVSIVLRALRGNKFKRVGFSREPPLNYTSIDA